MPYTGEEPRYIEYRLDGFMPAVEFRIYPVHGLITVIPVRHINFSYQRAAVYCLNTTERSQDSYSSMNDRALARAFTYCARSASLIEMNVQSSELISAVFTGFHVSLRSLH